MTIGATALTRRSKPSVPLPSGRRHNRTTIIQAAHRMLGRGGLAALTMEDIARECGLSRRTLYNHFASTQDLFVVSRKALIAQVAARGSVTMPAGMSHRRALARFIADAMGLFAEEDHVDLYLSLVRDGPAYPAILALYDQMIRAPMQSALADHLARQPDKQVIADPAMVASDLISALVALAISSRVLNQQPVTPHSPALTAMVAMLIGPDAERLSMAA